MRLIDADAILKVDENSDKALVLRSGKSLEIAYALLKKKVIDAPTVDAVVVTRCKDCEKSGVTEFGKRYCKEPMGCFFGCIPVEDDYFCSGGRRKDGGDG